MAGPQSPTDRGGGGAGHDGDRVGGEVSYDEAMFGEIASRVLRDLRGVRRTTDDVMRGFLGRLLAGGPSRPGIAVEDRGGKVVIDVDVVAHHDAKFYDLGLEIQRQICDSVRSMTGRGCEVNVNVRRVSP